MNESLTPQELLYLYLDGECTPEQVTMLFEAMSTDSELKKEFDEAVAFQQTLEEDKSKSAVPFSVTNTIFQRIGASIIPSSEIASTATVATTQSVSTSVFQAIWTFITNNSIVFGISALLTLITGVEPSKKLPESKAQNHSSEQTIPSKNIDKSNTELEKTKNPLDVQSTSIPSSQKNFTKQNQKEGNTNSSALIKVKEAPFSKTQNKIPIVDFVDTQTNIASVQIFPSLRKVYAEDDRPIIESFQQLPIKNSSRIFQFLTSDPLLLSIQLRSMNSIVNIPSRIVSETFTQNFGTAILITISKNHSIGLEISQETFPHYALETQRIQNFTTAPLFAAKETIMWTGATYQYSFDPIQSVGDVQPFIRTTAGASAIGGVSKAIVGLQVPITTSVFSTVGLESSLFFLNNASTINTSQKISLTYSLGWNIR